jgi:hypothetical protein
LFKFFFRLLQQGCTASFFRLGRPTLRQNLVALILQTLLRLDEFVARSGLLPPQIMELAFKSFRRKHDLLELGPQVSLESSLLLRLSENLVHPVTLGLLIVSGSNRSLFGLREFSLFSPPFLGNYVLSLVVVWFQILVLLRLFPP